MENDFSPSFVEQCKKHAEETRKTANRAFDAMSIAIMTGNAELSAKAGVMYGRLVEQADIADDLVSHTNDKH